MAFLRSFLPMLLLVTMLLGATSARMKCTREMDLTFLVDASGSICDEKDVKTCDNWRACLAFMHTIVNEMIIGENDVRVALTIFQTTPFPQWNLNKYYNKSSLLNAIDNLRYSGGTTDTISALDTLSTTFRPENGDRPNVRNVVILITDGIPRIDNHFFSMDEIRTAVKKVTDQRIQLIAVGVTDNIDMKTLKELSSPPHKIDEDVFFAVNYKSLPTVLRKLEIETCINMPERPNCTETQKMDIALLVDSSGSICNDPPMDSLPCDDWTACVAFIHAIVNDMTIGANNFRVAMILFDTSAEIIWNLKTYDDKSALLKAIDKLEFKRGTTNTIAALDTLSTIFRTENGDRSDASNTAIIITDGKPQNFSEWIPIENVRAAVKRVTDQGIRLLAVGVTDRIDMDTLKELSSEPHKIDETVFVAKSYDSLEKIKRQLEIQTCIIKPTCHNADVDITFLIDASGSICDNDKTFNKEKDTTCNNWSLMLRFLHRIINVISGPNTRVGLVKFRTKAHVVFNLTRYTDKSELLSAVDNLPYEKGGETNMTGALRLARTEVFNTAGDRPESPNTIVIITDGAPTDPSTVPGEIDAARNTHIRILALGITDQVDESTLRRLSAPPHQINVTYFMALNFVDIESFRRVLQNKICQESN